MKHDQEVQKHENHNKAIVNLSSDHSVKLDHVSNLKLSWKLKEY